MKMGKKEPRIQIQGIYLKIRNNLFDKYMTDHFTQQTSSREQIQSITGWNQPSQCLMQRHSIEHGYQGKNVRQTLKPI